MSHEELRHFLDENSRLLSWPAKPKKQLAALLYLADKFQWDRLYTERDVNELLDEHHIFNDAALLRRELYMKHFLDRKIDGSSYWRTQRLLQKEWRTKRLTIHDAIEHEVSELQKIYDECGYIGQLTGYEDPRENPMQAEFNHETLPPNGKPDMHRVQTIVETSTKKIVGYLIFYHGFPDPATFWIAVLAIRPTFQRQKLGNEVMSSLADNVKLLGYEHMGISVGVGNGPALKFWSSCGFTDILKTEQHDGYAERWIIKHL